MEFCSYYRRLRRVGSTVETTHCLADRQTDRQADGNKDGLNKLTDFSSACN
jgi:hypothetical protein